MGSGFGTLWSRKKSEVLRLNAPTHQSACLRSHGVGHREIARREDSRNLGICAHDVSLWVRMRRQIARPRADFPQFSELSDNRETGWWMTQSAANHSLHQIP